MPSGNVTINANVGGISVDGVADRTASGNLSSEIAVAAGLTGVMDSVNSALNAGTVESLETGHGLLGSDIIALTQAADSSDGSIVCRYGITVDTANANDIIFDNDPAASGDSVPVDDTAVVIAKYTEQLNLDFDGDDILQLVLSSDINCIVQFTENDTSEVAVIVLKAKEPFVWSKGGGYDNPLTGNAIGLVNIAAGSATAGTFKIGILLDTEV